MERASRRKYHYIYKTTCIITNRFYIGMHSTDNLEDGYIGSGKRLWYSINKYGKENHICKILEFLPDRSSLKTREKQIVNEELLNEKLCMNLRIGGEGGIINQEHHEKMKIGSSIFTKNGWKNGLFKKNQEISKNRLKSLHKSGKIKYDTFKDKNHTYETKIKIGKANSFKQRGENNSQYGKCWITNGIENKKIYKGDLIPEDWKLGRKI